MRYIIFCLTFLVVFFAKADGLEHSAWETINYAVEGDWSIQKEKEADHYVFSLEENFETTNAPDLYLYVSEVEGERIDHSNPSERAFLVGKLKTSDTALFFKKMKGRQVFKVSVDDVVLDAYKSFFIYCKAYNKLWAFSNFNQQKP